MYQILENCILFKGIRSIDIPDIIEKVTFRIKDFKKNEPIALSDDECRELYIVIKGSVRGEMIDFTGKTIKIEDIESPRMLAPAFLFGPNNRYPVTIIANNDVRLLSIPKESFIQLMQGNKIILSNYLNSISNQAQFLSNKIKFLSFQTIKGKIAHFLLNMMQKTNSDEFFISKSQNELAEMFGVARPSLARAMRELDSDGIIKASGKSIQIVDKNKLSAMLRN